MVHLVAKVLDESNAPKLVVAITFPVPLVLGFSLPAAIAMKGKRVLPVTACCVLCALAAAVAGSSAMMLPGPNGWILEPWQLCVIAGAAAGLAEGLLARSLATAYSGLLGGGILGGCTGLAVRSQRRIVPPVEADDEFFLYFLITFTGVALGIGLSLALGRWIRDLPKRKAEETEH